MSQEETKQQEKEVEFTKEIALEKTKEVKQLVKEQKYEDAQHIFADLMVKQIQLYQDEKHIELAQMYFLQADILLSKLEDNHMDVFGELLKAKEKQQEEEEADNVEVIDADKILYQNDEVKIQDETKPQIQITEEEIEKQKKKQIVDDIQISWENFQFAIKVVESFDNKSKEIQIQRIQFYQRLGDLEIYRDNNKQAMEEYNQALNLYKQFYTNEELKENRALAELYFLMGNCLLFVEEYSEDKETQVIELYLKSIDILETLLHKIIQIPRQYITVEVGQLEAKDLNKAHLSESIMDNDQSKELKNILTGLYDKVEDTILQRKQAKEFEKIKEQQKILAQKNTGFKEISKDEKIHDMGKLGNAIKRKMPDQEKKDE